MKSTWLGLSTLLVLAGCPEHEPQVLYVQGTIAPTQECDYKATVGTIDKQILQGRLDLVQAREGYFLAMQVVNGLSVSDQATKFGVEQMHLDNNRVQLVGLTVNYDAPGLSVALPQGFFVHTDTTIEPQGAGIGFANIFPPAVLQVLRTDPFFVGSKPMADPLLRACLVDADSTPLDWQNVPLDNRELEIVVRMTFEGVLQDGTEVRSNEYRFPVFVCTGCLLAAPQSSCQYASFYQGAQLCKTQSCNPGQDTCSEYGPCFAQNFAVDPDAYDRLVTCANTPGWPGPTVSNFPVCPTVGVDAFTPKDATNLLFRYAFERVNTYCNLRGSLFKPQ